MPAPPTVSSPMSPKATAFFLALEHLCAVHQVKLAVGDHAAPLLLFDWDHDATMAAVHAAAIHDCTLDP